MQTTNERTRYFGTNENTSTATRGGWMDATRKGTIKAWAGFSVLLLLCLASLAYVALGGPLALEASPMSAVDTTMAGDWVMTADAGTAARSEIAPDSATAAANYFPSTYVNGARQDDGNVKTYEHD
jgi:hypothetical protein